MRYEFSYEIGAIDAEDMDYFNGANPGYRCTGETLTEGYRETTGKDAGSTTYVVMEAKGKQWTPYGMCRDCGDHYIIAKWSRYDRIEKGTLNFTHDVDDR